MNTFSFVKKFPIFAVIALILIAPGLIGLITLPFGMNLFNMDVDFIGGTSMTFNLHTEVTTEMTNTEIPQLVSKACGVEPSSVQKTGDSGEQVVLRCTKLDNDQQKSVIQAFEDKYSVNENETEIQDVDGTIGKETQQKAIQAAVIAVVLMLLYITIRFEFTSGLAAITCLCHDLLVVLSAYIILRIPFNAKFIAVALTILGYSINSSIIVFDRVRENRKFARRELFEDSVDVSIRQTARRTLNTSVTTLLTVVMICIFAVPSLRQFILPMIVGILAGAFSSMTLAGPFWARYRSMLRKNKREREQLKAQRAKEEAAAARKAQRAESAPAAEKAAEKVEETATPAVQTAPGAPAQKPRQNTKKNNRKKRNRKKK